MKSFTGLAFGAALVAGFALAPEAGAQSEQQGRGRAERGQSMDPAQRIERRVGMMTERLQLSAPQATQIRQILTQEGEQIRALRGHGAGDANREALRPQMKSIRESTEQKIDAVLTESQRKTYAEMREQMRQRRGQARRG